MHNGSQLSSLMSSRPLRAISLWNISNTKSSGTCHELRLDRWLSSSSLAATPTRTRQICWGVKASRRDCIPSWIRYKTRPDKHARASDLWVWFLRHSQEQRSPRRWGVNRTLKKESDIMFLILSRNSGSGRKSYDSTRWWADVYEYAIIRYLTPRMKMMHSSEYRSSSRRLKISTEYSSNSLNWIPSWLQ